MKKILVIPKNLDNLGHILKTDINGIILPIEDLAVNSSIYFTIDDVRSIINLTSKEICVLINKPIHDEDLPFLEEILLKLNKLSVRKIFFYDVAVINLCQKNNIKKDLVIFQDHLNASSKSNTFYQKRGIKYSVITNDITLDEVNEISKNNHLMLIVYGYLPIFFSKRHLVSSYLEHIEKDKIYDMYYVKRGEDRYPILEEKAGTTIYSKKPINLINEIDDVNVDYMILNAFNIEDKEFMRVLNMYINNNKSNDAEYLGLMDKETVYKVEDYK